MMKRLKILSISSVGNRKRPFSYRSRIGLVSIPYQSRIDPVSIPYRSPIVLLSFSLPEAETIRKRCGFDTRSIRGAREEHRSNSSKIVKLRRFTPIIAVAPCQQPLHSCLADTVLLSLVPPFPLQASDGNLC